MKSLVPGWTEKDWKAQDQWEWDESQREAMQCHLESQEQLDKNLRSPEGRAAAADYWAQRVRSGEWKLGCKEEIAMRHIINGNGNDAIRDDGGYFGG